MHCITMDSNIDFPAVLADIAAPRAIQYCGREIVVASAELYVPDSQPLRRFVQLSRDNHGNTVYAPWIRGT